MLPPFIFLSKTPNEDENRDTAFNVYKYGVEKDKGKGHLADWIHKGYIGNRILEEDYFNEKVKKKLVKYFPLSEHENLKRMLEEIVKRSFDTVLEDIPCKFVVLLKNPSLNDLSTDLKLLIKRAFEDPIYNYTNDDINLLEQL